MSDNALAEQLRQSLATPATHATQRHGDRGGKWQGLLYPELSFDIIGAAIEVHRHVGAGQLESVYQRALQKELAHRGVPFQAQVPIPLSYKGEPIGEFFADFIIADTVIVELKAVERIQAVHCAQVLSYLRATKLRLGLLINFNTPVLFHGVKRIVN